MKEKRLKLFSLILSIVLLVGIFNGIFASADFNSEANIVDIKFDLSEGDKTYDGGANTYWKFEITADNNIGFGGSSYWKLNLQQYMVESQSTEKDNWEEHNALADIIRNTIYINGMSIQQGLDTDPVNHGLSTRVQAGDEKYDTTKKKLFIYVRAEFVGQEDNSYGLNDYTDFTFEIKEGLTLNGFKVNPIKYKFHADTKEFSIDDGTVSVTNAEFRFDTDYENDKYHLFKMKMNSSIENSLTDKELLDTCGDKIEINGKTLNSAIKEKPGSVILKTGRKEQMDQNTLYIAVKSDNDPFGLSTEQSFSIEFLNGLVFNNMPLNKTRYIYSLDTKNLLCDDGTVEFVSADFSEAESYITGAQERGPVWVIKLSTKDSSDILVEDKNVSYWGSNLQQKMLSTQGDYAEEHNIVADMLRTKILINGMTIDSALKATNECATIINTPDKNTLLIRVNKALDVYGIGKDKSFTLEIKSGFSLGKSKLSPITFVYSPSSNKFFIKNTTEETVDESTAANAKFAVLTSSTVKSLAGIEKECWNVSVEFDKDIYNSSVSEKNNKHLQTENWSDSNNSSFRMLRRMILINGTPISELFANTESANWDTFIQISQIKDESKKLTLSIPKDNDFGFSAENNFQIEIVSGLKLNGIGLNSCTVKYNSEKNVFDVSSLSNEEETKLSTATVNEVSLADVDKNYCKNHKNDAQWVITLKFDKMIYPDDLYSSISGGIDYYTRHIQASPWTSLDGLDSLNTEIRDNILINGKTLEECYEISKSTDYKRYIHIDVSGKTDKTLKIAIPKNNKFDFDAKKDFSIEIKPGLLLNGYKIKPFLIEYDSTTGEFNITLNNGKATDANVESAELETENGKTWVIRLKTNKNINISGGAYKDLQFIDRQMDVQRKELAKQLIESVTINGETIAESMERAGHHYTVRISAQENDLLLKVNMRTATTYDNDFRISNKSDFTVCIRNEIEINGFELQKIRYRFDSETQQFVVDNSEDIKIIADSVLNFTGKTRELTDSEGNNIGILLWPSGTSRYVDFYLDGLIRGTSLNSEIFVDEHGESVRKYIYVDGMSVGEWMEYGNEYQVMVRFEQNYIRLLLDGSREPSMTEDENHWVEFREGLVSAQGEKISPCKFYYNLNDRVWKVVDSFDGCDKPWWIENFEEQNEFIAAGLPTNPNYVRPDIEWNDKAYLGESDGIITEDTPTDDNPNTSFDNNINISDGTTIQTGNEDKDSNNSSQEETDSNKIPITVKKKIQKPIEYEEYFPTWAVLVIIVSAVLIVAATILFIIIRKRKKQLR